MDTATIEARLKKLTYSEIDRELRALNPTDNELVELLDLASVKVGNTAAGILGARRKPEIVADALLAGELKTKNGRMRATFLLNQSGKNCGNAFQAYVSVLNDKNEVVVSNALFGLAFLQDRAAIKPIMAAMANHPSGSRMRGIFEKALLSLERHDPFIVSPNYCDAANVWGLDPKRFGDRIG